MPKDDEPGQVFDVSKPNRTSPDPTSRPIIVGHQPMMSDPMVKDQNEDPSDPPTHSPVAEHKTITVHAPDANDDRAQPTIAPPVHNEPPPAPVQPLTPPPAPPMQPSVPAIAPIHPESVKAATDNPGMDQTVAPTPPPGDLHLIPVDDLIGHNHHGNAHHGGHSQSHTPTAKPSEEQQKPKDKKKGGSKALWILLVLIIIAAGAYLAIDSRVIKTSIKLPFHVFKQPTVIVQPATVSTTGSPTQATVKATDPYANWKTFVLSNEKLSFQYPSTWTIKDNTATVNDKGDSVTISGPNKFEMTINTGLEDYNLPAGGVTVDFADPIAFLAQQGYIELVELGKQNTNTVSFVNLSLSKTDPTAFPTTKNITGSNIKVSFHYLGADSKTVVTKPASFIKTDPNYVDTKLMLQSMHY